jgi:hypothetical protein
MHVQSLTNPWTRFWTRKDPRAALDRAFVGHVRQNEELPLTPAPFVSSCTDAFVTDAKDWPWKEIPTTQWPRKT